MQEGELSGQEVIQARPHVRFTMSLALALAIALIALPLLALGRRLLRRDSSGYLEKLVICLGTARVLVLGTLIVAMALQATLTAESSPVDVASRIDMQREMRDMIPVAAACGALLMPLDLGAIWWSSAKGQKQTREVAVSFLAAYLLLIAIIILDSGSFLPMN